MIMLAVIAATPLLLAVLGELVVERSGIINLGLEGMMLTGAMTGAAVAITTQSATLGFVGGVAGAALIAAVFGFFAIVSGADQIVTGTAINLLALGLTGYMWQLLDFGEIQWIPRVQHDAVVPIAWIALPVVLAFVLWKTQYGLRLRACGENPEAVHAAGSSVAALRWSALAIESLLAGIAGAHLALVLSGGFAENLTAGRGYIALSIVIFGRWKVRGAIIGTALFGVAAAMQYALQAGGRGLQFHLLLAVPYVVTLLILCGIAGRVRAPESLGR
jgi:simple sugar transport system permease protein